MSVIKEEELIQELQQVTSWPEFGYLLGIDKATIEDIKKENDDEQCKKKLVQCWTLKFPEGTYRDIIRALDKVGNNDLAARLKTKYFDRESDDQNGGDIRKTFSNLENQFTFLVVHAKEDFQQDDFQEVRGRLETTFSKSDFSSFASYHLLFKFLLQKHLNEFNTYALEVVADLLSQKFREEFQLFQEARQKFYRSVTVYQFEGACLCHRDFANDMESLVIKLEESKAKAISMEQLQDHVKYSFGEKVKYLGRVVAIRGSISVSWLISESVVHELYYTSAKRSDQHHPEWIQQVKIGGKTVYNMSNETPEEDQQEDQCRESFGIQPGSADSQLVPHLLKELEKRAAKIAQLENESKGPSDPTSEVIQKWTHLKDKFSEAQRMYSVISQQHPNAEKAKKICRVLQRPRPIILIPVAGPKKSGKTVLLNAILGGSVVHKGRTFPIYVEHVAERHLYCEADESPCESCVRLVTSTGIELARGRRNILYRQESLEVPENGVYYIIQTKMMMLERIPNDFPFTVYLADYQDSNITRLKFDFALSALLVPAVVYAVSTRQYMENCKTALKSATRQLALSSMVKQGSSEAQVVLAATFFDEVYNGDDQRKFKAATMKDELEGLFSSYPYSYCAVAGKWALKAREFMDEPKKEGLDEYMEAAWKWIKTEEKVRNCWNPDKIVDRAIGDFEERIKQSIYKMDVEQWVDRLCKKARKMSL